jgi:GntR family transcriptional regulator
VSRYEAIAEGIRRSILAGTYAPRQQLPSQRELARQWNTTVVTVRQALELLSKAGLITVRHGVGTFVADIGSQHELLQISSFAEELAARNLHLRTRLVSLDLQSRHAPAAHALRLSPRAGLVCLARLRLLGNLPILYQISYLPARYRKAMASYDASLPLYAHLRDSSGLVAASYEENLTPAGLPADPAPWLELPEGTPVILSRRISYGADGKPFLYDEAYMPPDRINITVRRTGNHYTVEYLPRIDALTAQQARQMALAAP